MRIIAIFISLLLTASFVHANKYTCNGVQGYVVSDLQFFIKEEPIPPILFKEAGPIGIFQIELAEHREPYLFSKDNRNEYDLYTKDTQIIIFYRESLKLSRTYVNTFNGGGLQVHEEFQCEKGANF